MSAPSDIAPDALAAKHIRLICQVLIILGLLGRLYGLNAPWKTHDHYNFGGVWTTTYAECLKQTPLQISKGVPHTDCWNEHPNYYRAHPPTILFALWGWTEFFGSSEAAYRLFMFFFSALNVLLIYQIAKTARPTLTFPWLAAGFQSMFLGNIYFGTHLDFIGEFTVFFVLLTALLTLRGHLTLAGLTALIAGVSAWPGYISLGPLWFYTLSTQRGRKRVLAFTALGLVLATLTMMWLHQTRHIGDFLQTKLANPGYISQREKGPKEPILFALNYFSSISRLLSPLFAAFAFFELLFGDGRKIFTSWRQRWTNLEPFHHAVILGGGTGFLYSLIGHEYFMVHVFLYLFLTPGLALLLARCIERWTTAQNSDKLARREQIAIMLLGLLTTALYPYGIFKSNAVHDAINSAGFILSTLALFFLIWNRSFSGRAAMTLVAISAALNVSQTINYRNEPDTERSFCESARREYQTTGQPVHTQTARSAAKDFLYCRDLPIIYDSQTEAR